MKAPYMIKDEGNSSLDKNGFAAYCTYKEVVLKMVKI